MAQQTKKRVSFTIDSILGHTEEYSECNSPKETECLSSKDRREQNVSSVCEQKQRGLSANGKKQFKLRNDSERRSSQLGSVRSVRQRKRNLFSPGQVRELVKCFRRKKYLSAFERESLARKINLSPKQVMIWFQNYRYKCRRLQKLGIAKENQDIDLFDDAISSTTADNHMTDLTVGCSDERNVNSAGISGVTRPLPSEITLSMADFSLLLATSLMYPNMYNFGSVHTPKVWERLPNTY